MVCVANLADHKHVAPFAGAWIEIDRDELLDRDRVSLPSRERGLKYKIVVPAESEAGRSLRGSVD